MGALVEFRNQKYQLTRPTEKIFKSPVVTKIESSELLNFLIDNVTKLLHDLGQKVESDSLLQLSASLQDSLTTDFKWITISEIPEIFKQGRRGEFGEFFGVNLNTIEVWIKKYYQTNRASKVQNSSLIELREVKPTKEQNDRAFNNMLNEALMLYSSTRKIENVYLYKYLQQRGDLPKHTPEFKKKIRRIALRRIYKSKGSKADTLKQIKRNALMKLGYKNGLKEGEIVELLKKNKVNSLEKENFGIQKNLNLILIGKKDISYDCKKVVLEQYFNKLLRTNSNKQYQTTKKP